MHFTIDQEDATTVFRLKEERLDSQNASQLKAEFLILAQADVETLIIDLSAVQYIDSAGLSALLLAERQMTSHGGEARLVGLNDAVLGLLRLTQLDRVFPIFNSVEEALAAGPSALATAGAGASAALDRTTNPEIPLAPGAPSASQIKAGAIAAGGSLGAAALAKIMMSPYEENLDELNLLAFGDDEDYDDEDDELEEEDFDDDVDEEEDELDEDLDEEDDAEDEEEVDEELIEDDEFEDDDFDDEELEEDEDEDY